MSYFWTHLANQKAANILNKLEPGFEEDLARFMESVLPNVPEIQLAVQLDFALQKLGSENSRSFDQTIAFLADENYFEDAVELYARYHNLTEESAREAVAGIAAEMTTLEASPIYQELWDLVKEQKPLAAAKLYLQHYPDRKLIGAKYAIERIQHKIELNNKLVEDNLDEEVTHLIKQGHTIEAIKHYRNVTGVGLADAFQVINGLIAGLPPDREFFFRRITFLLKNGSAKRATEVFAQEMKLSDDEAAENITLLQKHKIHPSDPIRAEIKKLLEQNPQDEAITMLMERRGLTQFAATEVIAHIEES